VVGWVLAILLGMAGLLPQSAQTPKTASTLPSVSISLPPDILSETVQISYFLNGPFGGHGGYATGRIGVHSYEIPALVEGKAATETRMIVYAPGCEIQTFVIPLAGDSRVSQEFPCQRVETVKLSGQIVPSALLIIGIPVPSWLSPTWPTGRILSMALPMGLLLGFTSQLSLRTRTGCFKQTCPISASTLKFLLRNKERAFA